MRRTLLILILLSFVACQGNDKSFTGTDIIEIKPVLENLMVQNLRDWEPPFNEEEFLEDFTQRKDFKFTVDGFHFNDLEKWRAVVYESMEYDRNNHKYYRHNIEDIQTTMLSDSSGIVTVNYVWDHITNDDLHYNTPATVTSVIRHEEDGWKLVNVHCSHGEKILVDE